jgi:hypothetical protein
MLCTATAVVVAIRQRPRGAHVEFGDLAEGPFGIVGKKLIDAALVSELWMALVAAFDFVASNLAVMLALPPSAGILCCGVLLLVLFALPPRWFAALSFVSVAAMCSIFVALLQTVVNMPSWAPQDEHCEPTLRDVVLMVGVAISCYGGHACLPSIYVQSAKKPEFQVATSGGFAVAVVYYFLMGTIGSLAFGSHAAQNIAKNVGHDLRGTPLGPGALLLQRACAAALTLKIQSITVVLSRPVLHAIGARKDSWGARVIFVAVTGLVASFCKDQIAAVMAVLGLLPVTCTSVIFPLFLHMYSGSASIVVRMFCFVGIVGATLLAVVGTVLVVFG